MSKGILVAIGFAAATAASGGSLLAYAMPGANAGRATSMVAPPLDLSPAAPAFRAVAVAIAAPLSTSTAVIGPAAAPRPPPPPPQASRALACSSWQPLVQGGSHVQICSSDAPSMPPAVKRAKPAALGMHAVVEPQKTKAPRQTGHLVFVEGA